MYRLRKPHEPRILKPLQRCTPRRGLLIYDLAGYTAVNNEERNKISLTLTAPAQEADIAIQEALTLQHTAEFDNNPTLIYNAHSFSAPSIVPFPPPHSYSSFFPLPTPLRHLLLTFL